MKRVWHCALIVALLVSTAVGATWAQAASPAASKPVAVVAFSGYNELKADIGYIGKLGDNPELAVAMEVFLKLALKNRGLEGLDKTRPWGLLVQLDEERLAESLKKPDDALRAYGVIPVTDMKALLAVLEPAIGTAKAQDGIYEISKADAPKFYAKQVGSWAFLAKEPKQLAETPANPEELLTGLTKSYDLAIRFDLGSIPEQVRNAVLAEMKKKARADLEKQKATIGEEDYAVRKILAERTLQAVNCGADDLADVTLGWALDNKAGKTYLDVTVTAKPDTNAARSLAALGEARSNFGGFLAPEATVKGNWTGQFSQADSSELLAVIDLVRKRAMAEIDKQPYDQAAVAAQLLDGLIDVVKDTLSTGRVDGGVAACLEPERLTVVAGGFVADGEKLDATLKRLVDAVCADHPEVSAAINWDAGQHNGVKLHAAYVPIPYEVENREKLVQLVGDVAEIVVATGKQSAYIAFGRKATATLKAAIDKSVETATAEVPPLRVSLDLGTLTKFAAAMGETEVDRQKAALAAALLEQAGEQDRGNLSASPVPNGVQFRLELEEGILKAAGMATTQQGSQAGK